MRFIFQLENIMNLINIKFDKIFLLLNGTIYSKYIDYLKMGVQKLIKCSFVEYM